GASLPPDDETEYRRDERHQDKDEPPHTTQPVFGQRKHERLWHLWRNADELFAAEQPVYATRHEIEPLLVLRQRAVEDEAGVCHHRHARGIHLHTFIGAAAFFDRGTNRQCCSGIFLRV